MLSKDRVVLNGNHLRQHICGKKVGISIIINICNIGSHG